MNYKHIAYNKDTGEVISTTTSNHLKRCIERANRWAVKYGYPTGTPNSKGLLHRRKIHKLFTK